jgi:hypothetical protein
VATTRWSAIEYLMVQILTCRGAHSVHCAAAADCRGRLLALQCESRHRDSGCLPPTDVNYTSAVNSSYKRLLHCPAQRRAGESPTARYTVRCRPSCAPQTLTSTSNRDQGSNVLEASPVRPAQSAHSDTATASMHRHCVRQKSLMKRFALGLNNMRLAHS